MAQEINQPARFFSGCTVMTVWKVEKNGGAGEIVREACGPGPMP